MMKTNRPNPSQFLAALTLLFLFGATAGAQDCIEPRGAMSFDGVDDVVVIGPATPNNLFSFQSAQGDTLMNAFTVEAWFKTTATVGFQPIVQKWGDCNGSDTLCLLGNFVGGWSLGLNNGSLAAEQSVILQGGHGILATGTVPWNFGSGLADGAWHHVAMTITPAGSSATIAAYIDGNLAGSVLLPPAVVFTSAPLTIGAELPNVSNPTTLSFDGLIDEVRIWDTARSAAEISTQRYFTVLASEPGLVGYWRLDEGVASTATQTIQDHSPSNIDGVRGQSTSTESGDPTWSIADTAPVADGGTGTQGQPNSSAARLEINGVGAGTLPGPFAVTVSAAGSLTLSWTGDPLQPLVLFGGSLNTGHFVNAMIGTLDIGSYLTCVSTPFSDISVLFDGSTVPDSLFFTTDATGVASQTAIIPASIPPGLFIAVQGLMGTTSGFPLRLTAAFQIVVI